MRLHVLSDLHIEFQEFTPDPVEADVIICGGDVHVGKNGIRFLQKAFPSRPVIYVLGNHEFYGQKIPKLIEELKQLTTGTNVMLLDEREVRNVSAQLVGLSRSKFAPARVHALWTLRGLNAIQHNNLHERFRDPEPGVRENALRILETQAIPGYDRSWRSSVTLLASDPSPMVRLQLARTLGNLEDTQFAQNLLLKLLIADRDDYWIRIAALSSLRDPAGALPKVFGEISTNNSSGTFDLVRDLADLAIARTQQSGSQVVEIVTTLEKSSDRIILAGLEGLDRGLARKQLNPSRLSIQPLLTSLARRNDDLFVAAWKVSKRLSLPETADHKSALDAAAYFLGHGFENVRCLRGGIDEWSQEVDTKLPRYRLGA